MGGLLRDSQSRIIAVGLLGTVSVVPAQGRFAIDRLIFLVECPVLGGPVRYEIIFSSLQLREVLLALK